MRALHANLASRPYRDYSRVYMALAAIAVLTAFLMVNNVLTAYDYFTNTKTTRADIDRLQESILNEQRRSDSLDGQIKRIDFKSINEQIRYVNAQIVERSFSWSQMLSDMERVVPSDVKLTALNPTVEPDGRISLLLTAVSRKPAGMVEMLNRLIDDPHFARPLPRSEAQTTQGTYDFILSVDYLPTAEEASR